MAHSAKTNRPDQRVISVLAYVGVCIAWCLSVCLAVAANNSSTLVKYHVSQSTFHILQIVFSVPGLLIWLTILFAVLRLRHYALTIRNSKESPGFFAITYALSILLIGLIINSLLGNLEALVSNGAMDPQHVKQVYTIINNYVSVVSGIATYVFLFKGSISLLGTNHKKPAAKELFRPLWIPFILLACVYIYFVYRNPLTQHSSLPSVNPTFGLPFWLIVITVVLPFLAAWMFGIAALIGLYRYRADTSGVVYKMLFNKLIRGMTVFICLTILIELLAQFENSLANSNLSMILLIIALLYLVLIYAFVMIAQGVKSLVKIETVLTG